MNCLRLKQRRDRLTTPLGLSEDDTTLRELAFKRALMAGLEDLEQGREVSLLEARHWLGLE